MYIGNKFFPTQHNIGLLMVIFIERMTNKKAKEMLSRLYLMPLNSILFTNKVANIKKHTPK